MGFLPSLLLLALSLSSLSLASPVPNSLKPRSTKACPTSGIISAYWPAWNGVQSPNQMPWADLSGFAMYFVAVTTATAPGFDEPDGNVAAFVSAAHAANKKAIFTIGGATGGVYFANLVRTAASRSSFANGILSFMVANSFQGVDIDWEYPGAVDAATFLAFLSTLRATIGPGYLITAAVPEFGWSFSAAPFAAYLDYITLMTYDMYGAPWAGTTGPNSPLAQCNAGSDSIQGSLALWKAAGFSACQMLLGIPGYGHQFTTYSSSLATTYFNGQSTLMFQSYNNQIPDQSPDFTALISYGWLSPDGTTGAGGFTRHWDSCTSTPFIFNPSTRVFISYDDAQSTKIKAQFAAANGLAGVNFYDSTGPTLAVLYAAKQGLTGSSAALSVSSSGLCGGSTGQTCAGSAFGSCCSTYGYCGSTSDFCSTGCQSTFGNCASSTPTLTKLSSSAATSATKPAVTSKAKLSTLVASSTKTTAHATTSTPKKTTPSLTPSSSTLKVSTSGLCGGTTGQTCLGGAFGTCCSQYGYCGSTAMYCGPGCLTGFGKCT